MFCRGRVNTQKREKFIAPIRADIGSLTDIAVWNDMTQSQHAPSGWGLNTVTVEIVYYPKQM